MPSPRYLSAQSLPDDTVLQTSRRRRSCARGGAPRRLPLEGLRGLRRGRCRRRRDRDRDGRRGRGERSARGVCRRRETRGVRRRAEHPVARNGRVAPALRGARERGRRASQGPRKPRHHPCSDWRVRDHARRERAAARDERGHSAPGRRRDLAAHHGADGRHPPNRDPPRGPHAQRRGVIELDSRDDGDERRGR